MPSELLYPLATVSSDQVGSVWSSAVHGTVVVLVSNGRLLPEETPGSSLLRVCQRPEIDLDARKGMAGISISALKQPGFVLMSLTQL